MKILIDNGATDNIGDLAMLEGIVTLLSSSFPEHELYVVKKNKLHSDIWNLKGVLSVNDYKISLLQHNNKSKYYVHLRKLMLFFLMKKIAFGGKSKNLKISDCSESTMEEFVSKFDVLHVGGGGFLNDVFVHELIKKVYLIKTFKSQGKPVVLTGQQVGPFNYKTSFNFFCNVSNDINFFGLRDKLASLYWCKKALVPNNCYSVTGDDSLGVNSSRDSVTDNIFNKFSLFRNKYIVINMRKAGYAVNKKCEIEKFIAVLHRIHKKFKLNLLFVPISYNNDDSDVRSGKFVQRECRDLPINVVEDVLTPSQAKFIIGNSFGAIGTSYHFCVFALSEGVPAVCLSSGNYYDQKSKGIADYWDDKRIAANINDDENEIIGKVFSIFDDSEFRVKINKIKKEVSIEWQNKIEKIYNMCIL